MRRLPARLGALAASGAVALAALALAAAPASAAAKPDYSVSITPGSIAGGSTGLTLTATITDESAILPVQVVGLSWPSALNVTAASLPAGYPAPAITTCGASACVQVRKLGLKPHKSVALTLTVNTQAACSSVTGAWHVSARSDLLFTLLNLLFGGSGSLNLDPASSLSTTVTDSCHFQFTQGPADAVVNQAITGTAFTPSGPALTVGIFDQNGIAVPLSGVSVAMGLTATAGTLGGTTTEATSAGVATFDKLMSSAAADGDTLTASTLNVPAIASAISGPFNVVSAELTCMTNPCDLSATSGSNSLAVSANGGTGTTLQGSILSGALACSNYPAGDFLLDPNVYQVQSSASAQTQSKTVTLSFMPPAGSGAPVVDTSDLDFGSAPDEPPGLTEDFDDVLAYSDVCFEATQTFDTRPGTPAAAIDPATGLYAGILPTCPTTSGPCHDRATIGGDSVTGYQGHNGTLNYTINLVVYIPASFTGDPRMN